MNKKILISLSVIVAVVAIVAGGTWAYFSTSATNEGNTFSIGELTILLGGKNNNGNDITSPDSFFDVGNMVPGGECEKAYVEVKNNGEMDMLFRAYAKNANGSTTLLDYLNVKATINPSNYTQSLSGTPYGPSNQTIFDGTLREMYGKENALDNLEAAYSNDDPLEPGYVAIYEVEVCLDFDTPNSLQDSSMTADLQIDATQYDGQTTYDLNPDSLQNYKNLIQW